MGGVDNKGKQGVFVESEESKTHVHNDGTSGSDTVVKRNVYEDNKVKSSKKLKGYGKGHNK